MLGGKLRGDITCFLGLPQECSDPQKSNQRGTLRGCNLEGICDLSLQSMPQLLRQARCTKGRLLRPISDRQREQRWRIWADGWLLPPSFLPLPSLSILSSPANFAMQ